jgi:hypothetical protein
MHPYRLLPAALLLLSLALPASASAKFDLGLDDQYDASSPTEFTLVKHVQGDARSGTLHFEYIPATQNSNSNQCQSLDWSNATATPNRHFTGVGTELFTQKVGGFTQGAYYCIRTVATLDDGTQTDMTAGQLRHAGEPKVWLEMVRASGASQIQVGTEMNAASQDLTYKMFAYPSGQPRTEHVGETNGVLPGADGEFHSVIGTISGAFVRGQLYGASVEASNATFGASLWNSFRFPYKFGEPYVQYHGDTTGVTTTSATLSTRGSGSGAAAPAEFRLYKGSSCFSHPIKTVSAGTLPADYDLHPLRVTVTGLDPATDYCWDAQATNDVSTQGSSDNYYYAPFTTLPLAAESLTGPSSAGSTTAAPTGEVVLAKLTAGCGKGPCTYTSAATAPAASSSQAAAAKSKRVIVATGKVKLKTGQESPITLKLTKAGTKLLTKKKALAVRVAVRGVDAAGRKDSKNVKAIFKARLRH